MNGLYPIKHLRLFILTLVLPIFIIACSDSGSSKKRPKGGHLVKVTSVLNSAMTSQQRLSGSLEAHRSVQIFNQEEGLILSISAYPGDTVEKDQVIIELDSKLILAESNKADIAHRQAALDLKRIKQLRKKRLATEESLTSAQTNLELTRAEKTVLSTRVQRSKIKATFNGIISQRLKEPGDVVAKFSRILTLEDISQLKAKVNISELLLPNIALGTKINIRIDALGANTFPAVISRIYPTINKTTRQGTIEVTLDNPPQSAKPGQLCRIILTGQTTPRLHVPLTAIKHNFNGSYVYKIVDKKAVITTVTTGVQFGTDIEVVSGLQANDKVVTQGFLGLKDKKTITIVTQ